MDKKKNCLNCRKDGMFNSCKTLNENEKYKKILEDVIESGVDVGDAKYTDEAYEFKENFICEDYKSRSIEYPIEVSKINLDSDTSGWRDNIKGKFVKIKPCNEKYEGKTYLGIYLGELPKGHRISHNSETKELNVSFDNNPAIFVFDLNEIIYGCQSWWGVIRNEKDLKNITDMDINNVWYVKALNSLNK